MTNERPRDVLAPLPLSDRFRLARRSVIDVDDQLVRSVFALPVAAGSMLRVRRTSVNGGRPQCLRLAAAVDLRTNGRCARDLAMRSSTSPSSVDIVVDTYDTTVVYLWNTWTIDYVDHAWLGNAGMVIEADFTSTNPIVRLSCSDGVGPVSFDDLVVSIEIAPMSGTRIKAEAEADSADHVVISR